MIQDVLLEILELEQEQFDKTGTFIHRIPC